MTAVLGFMIEKEMKKEGEEKKKKEKSYCGTVSLTHSLVNGAHS